MKITYFDPKSTSGVGGYINYHLSGSDKDGRGNRGPSWKVLLWIVIILSILDGIGKCS